MLHIVNGDATVARLGPAALPGDMLVWRDILIEGPVDAALGIDALAVRRATWLARRLGIPADHYVANGQAQAEGLARALTHDEIVLWFEHDLYCVANLGHLAAWLRRVRGGQRVSLVFPPSPLGMTEPAALAALFRARGAFTDDAIAHAATWWDAYAGTNPRALHALPAGPLPFLDVAARLHCERFPSARTGLGVVETVALSLLDGAPRPLRDLFRAAQEDARMRAHGMTDLQFASYVDTLADGPAPLVTITGTRGADELRGRDVAITVEGRAVRDGVRDRLGAQPLDWWLGGVHLEGRAVPWRWDPATGHIVDTRDGRHRA
jgi:hypothetical protein